MLAAAVFVGFLPVLLVVPTIVPPDPSVLSAAGLEGYNTRAPRFCGVLSDCASRSPPRGLVGLNPIPR